jgi:nucleoside-diphosphate-sugar epimerase
MINPFVKMKSNDPNKNTEGVFIFLGVYLIKEGDEMERKVALLTGATGFVGSHLMRRLLKNRWRVFIITRPQSNLSVIKDCLDDVSVLEHDGSTKRMVEIVGDTHPEVIFHLAALVIVEHRVQDIEPLLNSNVLFGIQLVEAMVRNGRYNLINTGTSWQHYQNQDYNPVCLYAATKQAFEVMLKFYIESTPLKVITLKLFDTYGINDYRGKLLQLLSKSCKTQEPLSLTPGEQQLNLVYIDDVVEAFLIAAARSKEQSIHSYEDFAVASRESIALKELVRLYETISGKKLPIHWGGKSYRQREVMIPWNQGKLLPKWIPKVDLREGLKKIIRFEN